MKLKEVVLVEAESKEQTIDKLHMRLSSLVKGGNDDLRNLRNKFGKGMTDPDSITDKDIEDAQYHIEKSVNEAKESSDLKKIHNQYLKNEDINAHTENAALLAKHFGTKEEQETAQKHVDFHKKNGYQTHEGVEFQAKMSRKYYPGLYNGANSVNESLTRKHFVSIAGILHKHKESMSKDSHLKLTNDIADEMQKHNPNFDRERFVHAATGVKPTRMKEGIDMKLNELQLNEVDKWSADVTKDVSHHPKAGLYAKGSAEEIASSENSREITFYLNRAGKNLSPERKKTIEAALEIAKKKTANKK